MANRCEARSRRPYRRGWCNFPKVEPPKLPKVVLPSRPKFRTHVADNVVTRSDSFVPAEDVLPTTGSRTTENILVGFAALGIGVALLGAASFSRRKSV